MYIVGKTFDDILRRVLEKLLNTKNQVKSTKGKSTEFTGVLIKLQNPRSRLSRTERKGTLFSCLGELLWYLSGDNSLEFINYYIKNYEKFSDDGLTIYGAYGPRFMNKDGHNQIKNVISRLKEKPTTRRAVIQLFDAKDVNIEAKDIPCTCTLQFFVRNNRLEMMTNMRSNDAYLGLPHDVFSFTMLQEIIARTLGLEVGTYYHSVGSLHLYEDGRNGAKQFINEGWQQTKPMPKMPISNPWDSIEKLLEAESEIRSGKEVKLSNLNLDSYWEDFVRILQIYSYSKNKKLYKIPTIKEEMSTKIYNTYIAKREVKKSHASSN